MTILSLVLAFYGNPVYPHFMRLHASVCPLLRAPEVANGRGSAERWRPSTPAMAAGVTEQVGTRQEVLRYRVPPWPPSSMV